MATSVLFISTGNSVRSQMAEGFLRDIGGDAVAVASVGSVALGVDPLAVAVMAERGVDISGQRSQGLEEYIGSADFDYLITVCHRDEPACPVFPGKGDREYWPFENPARAEDSDDERLARFREVRDQIEARVTSWFSTRRRRRAKVTSSHATSRD